MELILSLKNDYAKEQRKYPRTLTDMYGLMVVLELTRATPVAGTRNGGMNFRNVVADSEGTGNIDSISGGGVGRKLGCWKCLGENLKRNCPKRTKEKEKIKNDNDGDWEARGDENKLAEGKTEMKGGQLHTMLTSLADHTLGTDFSELGEGDEITWHQLHIEGWGTQ